MKTIHFNREISTAHRLYQYAGKCANVHGHNYVVDVTITTDILNSDAMVVEWDLVKNAIDHFDHALLLHKDDPLYYVLLPHNLSMITFDRNPTTEVFADVLASRILTVCTDDASVQVTLRETHSIVAEGYAAGAQDD